MEKIKKYGLVIILIILVIIAVIIGIVKLINRKKDEQEIKEVVAIEETEEEPPMIVDSEENFEEIEEEAQKKDTEKDENKKNDNEITYYIKVNNQANVVTIYTKDENGNYTVPYKAMICSIGTATPSAGNIYTIPSGKWDRWTWGQMEGGVWAQYYTRIKGSILFHSVPYTSKDKGTLEYWEYDKLGIKASAGCIRLTVQDAKWIYENCKPGTKVEFYADSNSGPLGKPSAKKISEDETVRGWDPTDPDANNPWRNYVRPVTNEPTTPGTPVETPKVDETPDTPTIPIEPVTPTQPEEPENPSTPTEPTNPEEPAEPTEPGNSTNSGESGELDGPTNPTDAENSGESGETELINSNDTEDLSTS